MFMQFLGLFVEILKNNINFDFKHHFNSVLTLAGCGNQPSQFNDIFTSYINGSIVINTCHIGFYPNTIGDLLFV